MMKRKGRHPKERYQSGDTPQGELIDPLTREPAEVVGFVSASEIDAALRQHVVRFALIHFPGDRPEWIAEDRMYDVWKGELRERTVSPQDAMRGFSLDDYPGCYCYLTSKWRMSGGRQLILFEMWH